MMVASNNKKGISGSSISSGITKSSRTASGSAQLEKVEHALREKVAEFHSQSELFRREAVLMTKSDRRQEALAALKRAKLADRRALTVSASADAILHQIAAIEDASMQAEITNALNSSVNFMKKHTKGLLNKTERAVDGSAEVKDLADDVNSALESLQSLTSTGANATLEDLEEELNLLVEKQDACDKKEMQSNHHHHDMMANACSQQNEKPNEWPDTPQTAVCISEHETAALNACSSSSSSSSVSQHAGSRIWRHNGFEKLELGV